MENVTDEMLQEIAAADYGDDTEKHFRALTKFYRGEIPAPDWHPIEVLTLTSYSEPHQSYHPDSSTEARQHWLRLFACVGLIRISENLPGNEGLNGIDSMVIRLTESAIALGPEVISEAISFLAWYVQAPTDEEERCPQAAVAILILASSLQRSENDAFHWLIATIRNKHVETDQWDEWENEPHRFFAWCGEPRKWEKLIPEFLLSPKQKNTAVRSIAQDLLRSP